MKKIETYLHLYLGCKGMVEILSPDGYTWEKPIKTNLKPYTLYEIQRGVYRNFKPILRPLSDMTEEEAKELLTIQYWRPGQSPIYERHSDICIDFYFYYDGKKNYTQLDWDSLNSQSFRYLLKQGFDVFNLIGENLAIDKTKQP